MTRRAYEKIKLSPSTLATIKKANEIIAEYQADGFDLTLRQLYYQFVSRDLLENKQTEYKRLGDIISKGRRCGLIDWDAIVDRTRRLRTLSTWSSPGEIIETCVDAFHLDLWRRQPARVEVWFEKDALEGVFERACETHRLPYFSCRGYTSDSEIWVAAQRLARHRDKQIVILHFGDHDPSGLDMTRDIRDRLLLLGAPKKLEVRRMALNMDQVDEYEPPPNPAKETDSRFAGYRAEHGDESWELDALDPKTLAKLVEDEVAALIEWDTWEADHERENEERARLRHVADNFDEIVEAAT